MDFTEVLNGFEVMKALLPQMQEALRERATQQAVEGGAAVAVRPFSFRHPLKGETDPWFGMAYQDWLALRNAGFKGIYTPNTATSERPKLYIIYDEAASFLKQRAAVQTAALSNRSESTARLRGAKQRRAKSGA